MAGSLNKVLLIGRLYRHEIKQMVNGKNVARLVLRLVNHGRISQVVKRKTEWHRIVIFNEGLVNVVQQYLKKELMSMLRDNSQQENGKMRDRTR